MQLITEKPYIIAAIGLRSRFSSKVGLPLMSAMSQVPSGLQRLRTALHDHVAGWVMSCRQSKAVMKSKLASSGSGSSPRRRGR